MATFCTHLCDIINLGAINDFLLKYHVNCFDMLPGPILAFLLSVK